MIGISVTAAEAEALERKAARVGQRLSPYARDLLTIADTYLEQEVSRHYKQHEKKPPETP